MVAWGHPGDVRFREREPTGYEREPGHEFVWKRAFPAHLSLICFIQPGDDLTVLDAWPEEGTSPTRPPVAVLCASNLRGEHISYVEGLPDSLSALVRKDLVPVVRRRNRPHLHFATVADDDTDPPDEAAHMRLHPFLLGPDEQFLAGSYTRSDEASVWLLPTDLDDPYPWIREALREWHRRYPKRFPRVPDWHDTSAWYSTKEAEIAARQSALRDAFMAKFEHFQEQMAQLDGELDTAKEQADCYERALLKEDADALAEAVACALADLGFHVVDMDQHWPPGGRREDLRVFDEDDPAWVAIVEVKGFKGGPKETELHSFGRWAELFILDHQKEPNARWFVANHHRAPTPAPAHRRSPTSPRC